MTLSTQRINALVQAEKDCEDKKRAQPKQSDRHTEIDGSIPPAG